MTLETLTNLPVQRRPTLLAQHASMKTQIPTKLISKIIWKEIMGSLSTGAPGRVLVASTTIQKWSL